MAHSLQSKGIAKSCNVLKQLGLPVLTAETLPIMQAACLFGGRIAANN
jgi:hypothetical protein